jgi:hypothetical protein
MKTDRLMLVFAPRNRWEDEGLTSHTLTPLRARPRDTTQLSEIALQTYIFHGKRVASLIYSGSERIHISEERAGSSFHTF